MQVKAPAPPPLPPDPLLQSQQQQAQATLITGLQTQSQADMASLMARYGTRLAMAGTNVSPLTGGFGGGGAYGTPSGRAA